MSEPGPAPGRDALLATKLHVPRLPPGFVARPRLTAKLDEGLAGRTILVCAPAGFGKTALLAAWASGGSRPVAWLSLDEGDNDPARFWRHVAAALDRARPGISGRVGPLMGPPPPQSFEGVVTALLNELTERPTAHQALLVLDDYHLIAAPQVHAAVQFLLDHLPPGLRLVLATRSDPPLRLGRLRARGELTELRAADLRFTETEAAELLRATPAEWQAAGQPALAAQGCNYLGQIRRAQGNLDTALDAYQELLRITELPAGGTSPVAGIGHVGIAEVAYQRGDLAAARRELQTGLPLCRQISDTQALATGLATLAWIRQAEGDPAGARQAMNEAERVGPSPAAAGLLNPVPAHRARLALAQGDITAVARWAQQQHLSPDTEPAYTGERDQLVLARLLLAQDQPHQALRLLARLSAVAESQGRTGSIVEIAALLALALAASGDQPAAAQELAETLALAAPQGYIRVFADEGPPMAALLTQVAAAHRDSQPAARQIPLDYLATVLRACAPVTQPPGTRRGAQPPTPGLAEPLTARETQVLHLLAAGAPNQRIADDLVVTLDTAKKHVTHVLGKLGAANRTEAVTRARQLGLIS